MIRRILLWLIVPVLPLFALVHIDVARGKVPRLDSQPPHHCIFDQQALRTKANTCRPRARTYPSTVRGIVRRAIYDSALTFGIPYNILLQIARCESALNPHATNGTHFGLFQFAPETFHQGSHGMKHDTGIVARSYWNAHDASYVAGYLFAIGRAPNWTCE
ncbi:MAG: hypothetical protein NVS2B16_13360 [Chloroflexota bacterium]